MAFAIGACGDDDDEPTTQEDLLVANNWVYTDIYLATQPIGLKSCGGDDFLSFTSAGAVSYSNNMDADTCSFTFIEYAGTYEVRNDSLIIEAVDTDGANADAAFEITLLNETELRLQSEDATIGTSEVRYTAQ